MTANEKYLVDEMRKIRKVITNHSKEMSKSGEYTIAQRDAHTITLIEELVSDILSRDAGDKVYFQF